VWYIWFIINNFNFDVEDAAISCKKIWSIEIVNKNEPKLSVVLILVKQNARNNYLSKINQK
jgi:hypothetical protein